MIFNPPLAVQKQTGLLKVYELSATLYCHSYQLIAMVDW